MDVHFNNLRYLHLLWGVVALLLVVIYGFARRRQAMERFASPALLGHLASGLSRSRRWFKAVLLLTAGAAIVLGLTDPRYGEYFEELPRRGMDVVFVLDVSRSMLARDIAPTRLERAKQYIRDVLEVMGSDRVGLVTFAGTAAVRCPLTVNYSAMRMSLDEVTTSGVPRGGSLLGDAIRAAADAFVDNVRDYKAIIVLSDGEDQDSYPVEAARKVFEERGARVYTVAIGDPDQGARIPIDQGDQTVYLRYEGQEVWTKMNPQVLRRMAEAAGGAYIPAETRNIDLGQIYTQKIASGAQREFEVTRVRRYHPRYQWPAGLALLLLVVESLVPERRHGGSAGEVGSEK